jgi:hypothetical protein
LCFQKSSGREFAELMFDYCSKLLRFYLQYLKSNQYMEKEKIANMNIKGKVIICDSIDEIGIKSLKNAGLIVDYFPEISAHELISKVG